MFITITSPNQIYIAKVRIHNKMIITILYSTLLLYISVCLLPAVYAPAHAGVGSCSINVNTTCIQSSSISFAYRSDLLPAEDKTLKSSAIQKDTPFILPFP